MLRNRGTYRPPLSQGDASRRIGRVWRGHVARRRVKLLLGVCIVLQAKWRGRLQRQKYVKEIQGLREQRAKSKKRRELERRRRAREQELSRLQNLSAAEVLQIQSDCEYRAVSIIQSIWRCNRARKTKQKERHLKLRNMAAFKIQRLYLKRLNQIRVKSKGQSLGSTTMERPSIPPERLIQIERKVEAYQSSFRLSSLDHLSELQKRVADTYKRYAPLKAKNDVLKARREDLLTDVDRITRRLQSMPPLSQLDPSIPLDEMPLPHPTKLHLARQAHDRSLQFAQVGCHWRRHILNQGNSS
mmetsp:Transcript_5310/g.8213  ORF Transcript_5310/g.8213 Transcript_5310/m.8213 type:complete len:300 (+) Transcript_5310:39-938(+)